MTENNENRPLTVHDWKLERKALVSELRLLIIASVALNQVLAQATLPTAITVPAVALAIGAPILKGALAFFGRS